MIMVYFIKRKFNTMCAYIYWHKKLRYSGHKNAYVIGTPTHVNIGDSAIALAEMDFIQSNGYENIIEITLQEYISYRKCIQRMIPKNAVIFLLGGGFMGSLWPAEEMWRRKMLEDYKDHYIVVFSQTIYYGADVKSQKFMLESVGIYNTKSNLTLIARENLSYEIMKSLYPNCNILLTPDIVLSMGQQVFNTKREGILVCFRKDKERNLSIADEDNLIHILQKRGYSVNITDTMSKIQINVNNRKRVVRDKLEEIASSKLLITDRLHGMVFAAITGTPCIVLANNHHKVKGTYEWISDLNYIEYIEDITKVEEKVKQFYGKENCTFHINSTLFSELSDLVYRLSRLYE